MLYDTNETENTEFQQLWNQAAKTAQLGWEVVTTVPRSPGSTARVGSCYNCPAVPGVQPPFPGTAQGSLQLSASPSDTTPCFCCTPHSPWRRTAIFRVPPPQFRAIVRYHFLVPSLPPPSRPTRVPACGLTYGQAALCSGRAVVRL